MTEKLHLVYATDAGYLTPTLVSVVSAIVHASDKNLLVVHILDIGISDEVWIHWNSKICDVTKGFENVVRHQIDDEQLKNEGLRPWRGSYGAYARLLLPEVLLGEEWCMYCDGDTLFTDDPLKVMAYFNNSYAMIGHVDGSWFQQCWYDKNGLALNRDEYVCSGVLLMNLKWLRENDAIEKIFRFLRQYPDAPYPDQDALNNVCSGFIKQLKGVTWGALSEMVDNSGANPGCIHYAGRLPSRMQSFGLVDVCRLWFWYARNVCRLEFAECGDRVFISRYLLKVAIAQCFRVAMPVLRMFPTFRHNCQRLERQFFTNKTWKMLLTAK